jgi:DNA polymerase (family 10)
MPVHNADIAALFEEIADRLEIQGANPFRIRAYRNAARTLGELPQDAQAFLEKGEDLTRRPGFDDDLAEKIR